MLSYKLKHLCSQMFASLAAFGLFSLGGGEARADVYKDPLESFNFAGEPEEFTVTAAYSDQCGIPADFKGISGAEFVTGASGSGYCEYTCKEDYAYRIGNTDYTTVTGVSGTNGTFKPGADCYPKPKCRNKTWSEEDVVDPDANGVASPVFESGKGYYCRAKCNDGFGETAYAGTGTYQRSISYATSTGYLEVEPCVGRMFEMKVDCGEGTYSGQGANGGNSGVMQVQYGKAIKLPGSTTCNWEGHTFSGFYVPDSAISYN